MKLIGYISLAALLVLLTACSSERNLDYLKSHNGPKLVIKPPLSSRHIDHSYVLANVGKIDSQSITPPGLKQIKK